MTTITTDRIVHTTTCVVMTTITLSTPSGVSVGDTPFVT